MSEFRGHHAYFGEMHRRQVSRALINGGRIHFYHPSGLGQQASAGISYRAEGTGHLYWRNSWIFPGRQSDSSHAKP